MRQGCSYVVPILRMPNANLLKIVSCHSQTEILVWSTANFICIVVILTVVLPEANSAYFVSAASMKSQITAAWTPISLRLLLGE